VPFWTKKKVAVSQRRLP